MKAVYTVTETADGFVRVALPGDYTFSPVILIGHVITDALGLREIQYDQLIRLDLVTFEHECQRRLALANELVWKGE